MIVEVFLWKNDWEIAASEEEAHSMMMSLASSNSSKVQSAAWLKKFSTSMLWVNCDCA